MNIAVILQNEVRKDPIQRQALINALQKSKGVLSLDLELAGNGLIFVKLNHLIDGEAIKLLPGVSEVETMGVMSINQ